MKDELKNSIKKKHINQSELQKKALEYELKMPPLPPGEDYDKNIDYAKILGLAGVILPLLPFALWYNKVRNNRAGREGSWDYKQLGEEYADGGNANYGAVGSALGIPEQVLLRGAGWAQGRAGSREPKDGHWTGDPPYGDDSKDQENIIKGIEYFRNR